ncbi:MAG TPA: hypothetical protein DDZ51_07585 [Planctomycetaceae bacterium]|nr:hypothetical protein [Planctomycetaceae bacterium]
MHKEPTSPPRPHIPRILPKIGASLRAKSAAWTPWCRSLAWLTIGFTCFFSGCGTTRTQEATEQLTLSAAVDSSIAAIDFRPMTGQKVFFDDTYIKSVKSPTFVNADYVISSLRQQIMAAGCLLQEKADTADIIIEGRIGALGADDHRVTYGIPENNVLGVAATFLAPIPTRAPTMPEIAVARRDAREGAAKVAAFAYVRETRQPLWQSGISNSIATSQNTWVLGVGPFQGGSIRDSSLLARKEAKTGARYVRNGKDVNNRPPVNYSAEMRFDHGWPLNGRPIPLAPPPDKSPQMVATNPDLPPLTSDRPNSDQDGLMGAPVVNGVVTQPDPPSLQR